MPVEEPLSQDCPLPVGKAQPLHIRLYFREYMTEIVRAIGYGDMATAQARERLNLLMERFGREKILAGAEELLEFDDRAQPPVARLKAEVARLAFQLLGPPPRTPSIRKPTPRAAGTAAVQEAATAIGGIPVNMPRYHVMGKYEEFLRASKMQFSPHAELVKGSPFFEMLPALDYVVVRKKTRLLVTVRPNLRGNQAAQMIAYSDALLANHAAVRVWPVETAAGWQWQEHELFAGPLGIDPKRMKLSLDDWRCVYEHADGDKKCGRDWLTGGCACAVCKTARAILTTRSAKRPPKR